MRKSVVLSIILGGLVILGFGGYLIAKEFSTLENNQNVKLDNKLIIGTYEKVTGSDHKERLNKIWIEIYDNGDMKKSLDYETDSILLIKDDNYPGCVFVDLTEIMSEYIYNLGIKFWALSNPDKNYVSVMTECPSMGLRSSKVKITDSGLWLFNIPKEKDESVQVEHCYIWQKNEVRF